MRFLNKPTNDLEEFTQKAIDRYLRKRHSDYWMDYAYEEVANWEPLTAITNRTTRKLYETIIASEDPDITDKETLMVEVWCIENNDYCAYEACIFRYEKPDETEDI